MTRLTTAMLAIALTLPLVARAQAPVPPPCRAVGDTTSLTGLPQFIRIDPAAARRLAAIGLDRTAIFARMAETSVPETMGCWALPVGDFDGQLISVGMAQWNFGTGSLQPLLRDWRDAFRSRRRFRKALRLIAPTYGKLLFSKACLAVPVRDECRSAILAAHGADGKLNPVIAAELTALFEDDAMLQVQADRYVALLDAVRLDLLRLFPPSAITMRKVRWAIDMTVQQGKLPPSEDVARMRAKLAAMPEAERWPRLRAILAWYRATAETIDQDGVVRDYGWNVDRWTCMIDTGRIDAEQYELLNLTYLKSRTAVGNSGRWQALTFSRRAKIALDVGSVSGKRDGDCVRPSATDSRDTARESPS